MLGGLKNLNLNYAFYEYDDMCPHLIEICIYFHSKLFANKYVKTMLTIH